MGGVGSSSWYRFNKKTTVEECRSLDVRRLYREGLLKPGYGFSWSWSRARHQIASIGGFVLGEHRSERVVLLFRYRSGPRADWDDGQQSVALEGTPCNFGGERPGCGCPRGGGGRRETMM